MGNLDTMPASMTASGRIQGCIAFAGTGSDNFVLCALALSGQGSGLRLSSIY